MASNQALYRQPMQPWPDLAAFGSTINLPDAGLSIFFYEAGEKNNPTMMLIHGLGDEADTWRHVIQPLSSNYHVIAPDLPGFGRSDQPDVDYTPKLMMDALLELMDALELKQPVLIGNSLGAMLSHAIALKQQERIPGIILVDGALLQHKPIKDWSLRLMQVPLLGKWLYTRLRKDPEAAFDSLRNVYHDLDQLPKADREFLFTRVNKRVWSDEQRRAYLSTLRHMTRWTKALQADLPDKLSNFPTPTLILRGEFDPLFTLENAKAVARVQPNAEFHEIKGSGHLPHQETPSRFSAVVKTWLIEQIPVQNR